MVRVTLGYYVEDTDGDVYVYFCGAEPPEQQFILIDGAWRSLIDGYYLMDKIIDGSPEVSDPVPDPPEGVPPYESAKP